MKVTGKTESSAVLPSTSQKRLFGLRGKNVCPFLFYSDLSDPRRELDVYAAIKHALFSPRRTKSATVTKVTEEVVAQRAKEVASQCKVYLITHPELKKAFFDFDLRFKRIAVQKIGVTGYTAVYETAESDGVWRLWTHINPNVVALTRAPSKSLSEILFLGSGRSIPVSKGEGVPGLLQMAGHRWDRAG